MEARLLVKHSPWLISRELPSEVAARSRYGDWQVALIQGAEGRGYLLSLSE